MELNQTISELQEEMKLLKGEIKSVLTEIRTAVLNADNPFTLDIQPQAASAPQPSAGPAAPVPEAEGPYFSVPATPREDGPAPAEPPAQSPAPAPQRTAASHAAAPVAPQAPEPAPHEDPGWSLVTIAGLMLWAEDAVATLGAERLRMVVELAAYAALLPPGARDVLVRVAELAPKKDIETEPAGVIDCVVVLHQLEAILRGDHGMRLPGRREGRLHHAA